MDHTESGVPLPPLDTPNVGQVEATLICQVLVMPFTASPRTGKQLTDLKRQFRGVLKDEQLTDVRFHDLRHTFASHLVMNGVDLKTVATLLGHSTTRMSERYAHLSPDHPTRAVKVLDTAYRTDTVEKIREESIRVNH